MGNKSPPREAVSSSLGNNCRRGPYQRLVNRTAILRRQLMQSSGPLLLDQVSHIGRHFWQAVRSSRKLCSRSKSSCTMIRPLRAGDDNVPAALLPCDSASRASTVGIPRGDDKSDRGVDFAPDHRGVSLGQFTSLSNSGSRHCVWLGLQAAVACHGHSGQADRSPIAVAEPIRREVDRHDPAGMSRPHDRIWGGAPALDPGSVCRVL
jgi:hypothetical protein